MGKQIFKPILDEFSESQLQRAVDDGVYLPEVTLQLAPGLMKGLVQLSNQYSDKIIREFTLTNFMKWLKENKPMKYKWFKCGGQREKERMKWLRWNFSGYKKFILND